MGGTSLQRPSPLHSALIFFGVLAVGLVIQITLWLIFPVADQYKWAADATKINAGIELVALDQTYMHPGTTVKYPMAALIHYGVEPVLAVRLVMALFSALCIALSALVAYRLWPQHLVWLSLALILIPDLRLLHATPPSTAASLLLVAFVLIFVYARQTKERENLMPLLALGVCAGTLLATRTDTGAFVLITAAPFLFYMFRLRVLIPLGAALFTFTACNPELWVHPIAHLESIPRQMFINEALEGRKIFGEFLLTFPLGVLSVCAAIFLTWRYLRAEIRDMPVSFGVCLWFLGATLLFTALLAPLSFHPIRYFMPFYLVWDILLPLWLGTLARHYLPYGPLPWLTERRLEWIVVGSIVLLSLVRLLALIFADTREVIL